MYHGGMTYLGGMTHPRRGDVRDLLVVVGVM